VTFYRCDFLPTPRRGVHYFLFVSWDTIFSLYRRGAGTLFFVCTVHRGTYLFVCTGAWPGTFLFALHRCRVHYVLFVPGGPGTIYFVYVPNLAA
jgi:hypothetical protein